MEFLTLHQLSRELNKPEKVLRYKFKNLLKKNTLVEGEDFIREGYIDDKHFLFKINPVRFAQLTELAPAPPPDTPGYQRGTNPDTNGYQVGTKSGNQPSDIDTRFDSQQEEIGIHELRDTRQVEGVNELIEFFKEQLRKKDEQLEKKDQQLENTQNLVKEVQNINNMAMSEIIKLNRSMQLMAGNHSATRGDTNGYQTPEHMDTNTGNQKEDVDTNIGNSGYQSNAIEHQ